MFLPSFSLLDTKTLRASNEFVIRKIYIRRHVQIICIISMIKKFFASKSIEILQKTRGDLLYKSAHVDRSTATISINDSLGIWFTKQMRSHPSYSLIIGCNKCKHSEIIHECVVNLKIDESQSLANLDKLFRSYITNYRLEKECNSCKNLDQEISFVWNSYLLFDVEIHDIYDDLHKPPYYLNISTVLGDVNSYAMVGVITRECYNRFIDYCKNLEGFWTKRDSIAKKKNKKLFFYKSENCFYYVSES